MVEPNQENKRPADNLDEDQFEARYMSNSDGPRAFLVENITHDDWEHLGEMAVHAAITPQGFGIMPCAMMQDVLTVVHYQTFGTTLRQCDPCQQRAERNKRAAEEQALTPEDVGNIEWQK